MSADIILLEYPPPVLRLEDLRLDDLRLDDLRLDDLRLDDLRLEDLRLEAERLEAERLTRDERFCVTDIYIYNIYKNFILRVN